MRKRGAPQTCLSRVDRWRKDAAQGRTLYGKLADLGLICRRTCGNRLRCRAPATSNSAPPSRPRSSSQCSWGPQFIRHWNWNRYAETRLAAVLLISSPGHEPVCARATARSGHGDSRLCSLPEDKHDEPIQPNTARTTLRGGLPSADCVRLTPAERPCRNRTAKPPTGAAVV